MTREEIYKEIVSAVKELHIALGAVKNFKTVNRVKRKYNE